MWAVGNAHHCIIQHSLAGIRTELQTDAGAGAAAAWEGQE